MKLFRSLALSLLALTTGLTSTAHADPRGGAGVNQNGQLMSFYSAGLYVEPSAQTADIPLRIPAIQKLENFLTSYTPVSMESKKNLMMTILPTSNHQYMFADAKLLTPEIKARLVAEFQRVTGVDPSKIRLFALTDTSQRITYLLPGFEKLSSSDQMAILFHETQWLLNPNSPYDDIVKAEMSFEAALKNPGNAAITYDFVSHIGNDDEIQTARLKWEVAAGHLAGFADSQGRFTLGRLMGEDYIACRERETSTGDQNSYQTWTNNDLGILSHNESCAPLFRSHLTDLIARNPKSLVLQDFQKKFDSQNGSSLFAYRHTGYIAYSHSGLFSSRGYSYGCFDQLTTKFVSGRRGLSNKETDGTSMTYNEDIRGLASCVVSLAATGKNVSCPTVSVIETLSNKNGESRVQKCTALNQSFHMDL